MRVVAGALSPGKVIGDGRYRLLARVGVDGRERAQLWRARDGRFKRDVGLTVLTGDPADARVRARARRTLDRATQMAGVAPTGVARVLDVDSVGNGLTSGEGVAGMVVAEWIPGPDVVELVAGQPLSPGNACRLVEPLAVAVQQAHHQGVVFGVGHPRRFRLSPTTALRLAFPGPPSGARPSDDVRGLLAILYLLLTSRWPVTRRFSTIPTPRELHPAVPAELSDFVMGSLTDRPTGIRTSATLLPVLRQVIDDAERTEVRTPVPTRDPDSSGAIWTTKRPANDPSRKKKLALSVAVLMTTTMAVLAWLGTAVGDFLGAAPASGAGPSVNVTAPPPTPANPNPAPPPQTNPIPPAGAQTFNVSGDADSAGKATRAVDGDPSTTWQTDTYLRQFPSFKPGIGLMVSLAQPANLSRIGINSPSPGTKVEIRTAPTADSPLTATQIVATATLSTGANTIDLQQPTPTQHVLIWITQLAGTDRHYQSAISELTFITTTAR
jgi:hypothetical protein